MSLTQTTTRVETMTDDLQRRLQAPPATLASGGSVQQIRFRATGMAGVPSTTSRQTNANLSRRFSFVWPFISKENAAGTEPFLKSRCSQLLRQFPAFLSGHDESTRTLRDLISRVLTQLKAVWLVLAVYLSLLVLAGLSATVLYAFVLARKPPGLWFLTACIAATGAIASVSLSANRERPRRKQPSQQPSLQPSAQPPKITLN